MVSNEGKHSAQELSLAAQKAKQASYNLAATNAQIKNLKNQIKETGPSDNNHVAIKTDMDIKTGKGLVVSVEAVKKPNGANKVQELAAMEEALKKATDEAHKQRMALEQKENP